MMSAVHKLPQPSASPFALRAGIEIRGFLKAEYPDIYTPEALAAIELLARFDEPRRAVMAKRTKRRRVRSLGRQRISFLDASTAIAGTAISVQDARDGKFTGSEIPADLRRQWIQGTGPAAKPNASVESSIRNVAYALLSGADGWMFDGEDALGQITSMSLDNQRNLKLAIDKAPVFMEAAEKVAGEMNRWASGFLGRKIIEDWRSQLDFTTKIFRARGLHLDDRHVRHASGAALSASIVDIALYVVNNYRALREVASSIVLYLPKIQTVEEAALWNAMLSALEEFLELPEGTIKVYVLVEQLEATFQLMEIRALLGQHFVGFNTGRWDYINSVADAMAWDPDFINPNIEDITMTYGYMRVYEDRVRRAVNTPDANGNCALWQGGMEQNIPVGSEKGVAASMEKAVAGAEREQREGASGKWVAHWKMVHIVRPVWEKVGEANQLGRAFPPLEYDKEAAGGLTSLEPAPRTIRGARNLLSVALQYGNAFARGFQAAALKPADLFGDDDILYLMEDMATGEFRLSILWEWIHKRAALTEDDPDTGHQAGDIFTVKIFQKLLEEDYARCLAAQDKDLHNDSKTTTLPIAREVVEAYVLSKTKMPWYIDLLNINLNNHDLSSAKERVGRYMKTFAKDGSRITENLDFEPSILPPVTSENEQGLVEEEITRIQAWFSTPRFKEITRLYSARQVADQLGAIATGYTVAKAAAEGFYSHLRALFCQGKSITTFGPYSPGQAVAMKRMGIEGIYLGGWATSAKGSVTEDPGPDLASYPLSQVPEEAAPVVRALLTADRNQRFARSRMSEADRTSTPIVDYSPFIIADADTGHGGEAHVMNLIRRFAEVGVPGYHIEDQKPGVKKCGHQGGKVLVPQDEQIKRLNAARFQLDIMGVPGILVARTDAESATYLDGGCDERDQPFILGATNRNLPCYKVAHLSILKRFSDGGVKEINGHLLYQISDSAYEWMDQAGVLSFVDDSIKSYNEGVEPNIEKVLAATSEKFLEAWHMEAGLKTYGQAVADVMRFQEDEGAEFDMPVKEWSTYAKTVSFREAREKAKSMGITIIWDVELAKTPEGYYQIQGGIEYAIAKSLAAAPFTDIIWMETKTADLKDAKTFAGAIHAAYPEKMLAYNLSPSFNWDTTGMSDEEMRDFPEELGKLGFVFNFITYGGHQVDGLASEEFATALLEDGMLALARLQRKLRLTNSPYKTPQTYVGGPRLDSALMASSGRTAATKAMGKGSTQFQHLVQTEVPTKLLESWFEIWAQHYAVEGPLRIRLRPHTAGSELLELNLLGASNNKLADVIFAAIKDRGDRSILSVRDQNTFALELRKKRLMTLMHLFLVHRYKAVSVHYVSPTDDNEKQTKGMQSLGIYDEVNTEIGDIIVAAVNQQKVRELLDPGQVQLNELIAKK